MSRQRIMRGPVAVGAGLLTVGLLVAGSGCGGGEFGEKINVPVDQQVKLESPFAEGKAVRYPAEREFNVADAQRSSTGQGTADSWAKSDGTAKSEVAAPKIGTAEAEFQVGQVVHAPSDEAMKVTAIFNVDYECFLDTDLTDTTKPLDSLALKVYVRDSAGNVEYRQMLANAGASPGVTTLAGRDRPSVDITMQPNRAYHFVLAGRLEIQGTEQSGAKGAIEIKSFNLELVPKGKVG